MQQIGATFLILVLAFQVQAQVVELVPPFVNSDDSVTIIFDASQGNGDLNNFSGNIYIHTGLITINSTGPGDWKYTQGIWATADNRVLMQNIGNNQYRISFHIRSFYGLPGTEDALQLACVFRSQDGLTVGRNSDGSDILIAINGIPLSNYVSHQLNSNVLTVFADNGALTLEPYTNEMIRVSFYPNNVVTPDTSYSLVLDPNGQPDLIVQNDYLEFSISDVTVRINKNPLQLSFKRGSHTFLEEESGFFQHFDQRAIRFKLSQNEEIYGTGSRAIPINRRGQALYSYNRAQFSYNYGEKNLHANVPLIISSEKYGIYFENYNPCYYNIGEFDPDVFEYGCEGGQLSYFVITGDNFTEILDQYTSLTGKQPLPPRWALGYLQSRFGYQTEGEARNTVSQMIQEGFPIDALILDIYWFGPIAEIGNLNWDYNNWPNPTGMMNDFKNQGVKTVLITQPYMTQASSNYNYADSNLLFGTDQSGNFTYIVNDFWAGAAGLLDFTNPATKNWMWGFYKGRADEGVAGWWSDVGEPENHPDGMHHNWGTAREIHNPYPLFWAELIHENYKQEYPDTRLFNLVRGGYAGMQRYSTFPWSGDVNRSYTAMEAQIPIMLGMGMSGSGYMHSDLGGFTGGVQDNDLYARWVQFGAFTPIMRPHSEGVPAEPIYYPNYVKEIVKEYTKLRYRLLPYNYTLAWQNSTTGIPLARQMNYYDPDDPNLGNINDQYYWGDNFLVAPVLNPNQTQRTVILPEGNWIDYHTNQVYSGNNSIMVNAPLEKLPLFVRSSSIIPMSKEITTTGDYSTDSLIIKYYPDPVYSESLAFIYDDDGTTPDAFDQGEYELIGFAGFAGNNASAILISKGGPGYSGAPANRSLNFQIQNVTQPVAVIYDSTDLTITNSYNAFLNSYPSAYWDSTTNTLHAHFNWDGSNTELVILNYLDTTTSVQQPLTPDIVLHPAYPNPFNNFTKISFSTVLAGDYEVRIIDLTGRLVLERKWANLQPGNHYFMWDGKSEDGTDLTNGSFIIKLDGDQLSLVDQVLLFR